MQTEAIVKTEAEAAPALPNMSEATPMDSSALKFGKLNTDFMAHISNFLEIGTDDILDLSNCALAYLKYTTP